MVSGSALLSESDSGSEVESSRGWQPAMKTDKSSRLGIERNRKKWVISRVDEEPEEHESSSNMTLDMKKRTEARLYSGLKFALKRWVGQPIHRRTAFLTIVLKAGSSF